MDPLEGKIGHPIRRKEDPVSEIARRITIVSRDQAGRSVVIHERLPKKRKRSRRKRSKWLKPLEQIERRVLRANEVFARALVRGHNRSNTERKDGWIYDAPANVLRAEAKYYRRLLRR
jgi:hypothetical protein